MRNRFTPSTDLVALIVWPLAAVAIIALFSSGGMIVFNWLQRTPDPYVRPVRNDPAPDSTAHPRR